MAQIAAASNGATKNKTAQPAQNSTAPLLNAPAIKIDPPKEEPKIPAKPVRTIDEALVDIRQRAELADKLEDLLGTKARLEQFRIGSVGLRDRITISDGQREFSTSNTAVMDRVYKTICEAVDEKVSELEKMLIA